MGLSATEDQAFQLLRALKHREHEGLIYEDASASFELLALRILEGRAPSFQLLGYTVTTGHRERDRGAEATVKVQVGGQRIMTAAEGNGPVHALDLALRQALLQFYPHLSRVHLTDYRVRVVDNESGTDARVRVWIQATDGRRSWNTVGASPNIVAASAAALVDSQEYYLLTAERVAEATLTG
jgi:2-isopropylmalate synthase